MGARPAPITIDSTSDLARLIRAIAAQREPLLVDIGDEGYELRVRVRRATTNSPEQDSFFNIIGISTEGEPTDIARDKRAYVADAVMPRQ